MIVPKIKEVIPGDQQTLIVTFDNGKCKRYDVKKLLMKEMYSPLKNKAFFKNVKIEPGGYAVYWNDMIDISEYELWQNGIDCNSGGTPT